MGLAQRLQQRVKASKFDNVIEEEKEAEEEEEEEEEGEEREKDEGAEPYPSKEGSDESDVGDGIMDDDASGPDSMKSDDPLTSVSFGALASAQASLGLKRRWANADPREKRQRSSSPFHEARERRAGKKIDKVASRSSKHAPTELSSKKAVSRKRAVIAAPTIAHRDPRFSAASGKVDLQKIKHNYGFLDSYRISEIAGLKTQIKSTRDPSAKEELKRELRVMEDRERTKEMAEQERKVIREHRKKEKEAVKEGKNPYYLKKGDIKKAVLIKRFEGMGEKKVERLMERRRKKKASRERKSMPEARRTA